MQIDQEDGTVSFPNTTSIGPTMTQEAFRSTPVFENSRSQDYGTLPWIHYHFSAGQLDGRELHTSVCFYDQMLVYVNISVDFYPPGSRNWSEYSLDVEAKTKQFHDRLLRDMLGKPTKGGSLILGRLSDGQETLAKPLCWQFPWGVVSSAHDSKGGGTFITVSYGNRHEEASMAYKRHSKSLRK